MSRRADKENKGCWTAAGEVRADAIEPGAEFGNSVALRGNRLAVGGWLENSLNVDNGAAYLFERRREAESGWVQLERVVPCDASPGAGYGHGIALAENELAMGAFQDATLAPGAGRVWVLSR